eukprot:3941586-Rhodomonas_salina.1
MERWGCLCSYSSPAWQCYTVWGTDAANGAMGCPELSVCCYAVSGSVCCYAVSGTDIAYGAMGCPCYGMSGTDIAYGAMGCP